MGLRLYSSIVIVVVISNITYRYPNSKWLGKGLGLDLHNHTLVITRCYFQLILECKDHQQLHINPKRKWFIDSFYYDSFNLKPKNCNFLAPLDMDNIQQWITNNNHNLTNQILDQWFTHHVFPYTSSLSIFINIFFPVCLLSITFYPLYLFKVENNSLRKQSHPSFILR